MFNAIFFTTLDFDYTLCTAIHDRQAAAANNVFLQIPDQTTRLSKRPYGLCQNQVRTMFYTQEDVLCAIFLDHAIVDPQSTIRQIVLWPQRKLLVILSLKLICWSIQV